MPVGCINDLKRIRLHGLFRGAKDKWRGIKPAVHEFLYSTVCLLLRILTIRAYYGIISSCFLISERYVLGMIQVQGFLKKSGFVEHRDFKKVAALNPGAAGR
jgi:hypothetical protein